MPKDAVVTTILPGYWVEILWLDQADRTFAICGRSPKWLRDQRKHGLRVRTEPTLNPRSYVLHSELVAFLKARAIPEVED
jgi:hypothetical protein